MARRHLLGVSRALLSDTWKELDPKLDCESILNFLKEIQFSILIFDSLFN